MDKLEAMHSKSSAPASTSVVNASSPSALEVALIAAELVDTVLLLCLINCTPPRYYTILYDTILHHTIWHDIAQHGMAWHDIAQHGIAWHNIAQHGIAWHDIAQHGIAWHSIAQHGIAWHSMA